MAKGKGYIEDCADCRREKRAKPSDSAKYRKLVKLVKAHLKAWDVLVWKDWTEDHSADAVRTREALRECVKGKK